MFYWKQESFRESFQHSNQHNTLIQFLSFIYLVVAIVVCEKERETEREGGRGGRQTCLFLCGHGHMCPEQWKGFKGNSTVLSSFYLYMCSRAPGSCGKLKYLTRPHTHFLMCSIKTFFLNITFSFYSLAKLPNIFFLLKIDIFPSHNISPPSISPTSPLVSYTPPSCLVRKQTGF